MERTKVLVVEDESVVAEDIEISLKSLGYAVPAVVSSGEEAVERTEDTHPDLVLMDIVLKGKMDGVQAAGKIYDQFNIPVVYLTAYADEKTLQRAKKTEPFGYVVKPFEERELRSCIEVALRKSKTETKLRKSEESLTTVIKSMCDAVITTDMKGSVTFMNPVAETLTGSKQKGALGKGSTEVFNIINEKTGTPIESPATKALREGAAASLERHTILVAEDGTERPILGSAAPMRDEKGNVTGAVWVFRDITERKKAEEKRQRTLKKLRRGLEAAIQTVALTVEMKSAYMAGHQRRVTDLASAIAKEMHLSGDKVDGIRMAGSIHDIGKIGVPAEILNKPVRLAHMEFELIKTHPAIGYNILKEIQFPWPVATIVLQHHERIDGSGYPDGLSGDAILIEARILGVADAVEAMSSHRPFRPALGINKALEEMREKRGILYDQEVVDACLEFFTEKESEFK